MASDTLDLLEVVVPADARITGRSALDLRLLYRHGVTLLGVSRQGRRFRDRVRKLEIRAGDVLLLLGNAKRLPDVVDWLGCLPLAERGISVIQRQKAWAAVGVFAAAILAACAFLTPIGHKNNTIIMGPGGYRFGDYWRMGLPLEMLVVAVGLPMILVVWPL